MEIPRGIIVLTKCDLVDSDLRELAALETRELVAGSFLDDAPVVEVSSTSGEGIDALKQTLFEQAEEVPGRKASGLFRLPVDRVFSMKGFGTVVTGTLVAGAVRQDDEVEILPRGSKARADDQVRESAQCFSAADLDAIDAQPSHAVQVGIGRSLKGENPDLHHQPLACIRAS